MKKIVLAGMVILLCASVPAFSQIRKIPKAVEETFTNQYREASDIDFKDQLVSVDVHFLLNGDTMVASYTNKGIWKETLKRSNYDELPQEVKDGFKKSKYADREVEDVTVMYLPGDITQYRLKAKKNGVEKKYLFFNPKGRMLRESITL
ncbi:MAG TPA: PepSY-like domain-containing protein [Chitinophagaceae bacterium]|nr:PepSY-like domain-containing protein [Chitinophagaceae bacterium]